MCKGLCKKNVYLDTIKGKKGNLESTFLCIDPFTV